MSALQGVTLALLLGLLSVAFGTSGQPDERAAPAAADPSATITAGERHVEARQALQRVTVRKRDLVGTTGPRRRVLVEEVIEGYRAVRRDHPGAREVCAEAAFRAGEMLRTAGRAEEAETEFRAALALGARTPFGPRAGLEIGHLVRRAGRLEDALAEYGRVRADGLVDPELRMEATWWAGRMEEQLGRSLAAVRLYEQVASGAEDPIDQIRGYDSWAGLLVRLGELEGAAGVLERCRVELRDRALEETRFGQRVRASLEGMRAQALLERAVAERRAAREAPHEALEAPRAPASVPPPRTRALRDMGRSSPLLFPPTGA